MKHIKDLEYKGHEIVIMQDSTGYAVDIRSDNFDGEMVDGYLELATQADAINKGKEVVDKLIVEGRNI